MEKPFPWLERVSSGIVEVIKALEEKKKPATVENVASILRNNVFLIPSEFIESNQALAPRSSHLKLIQELEEEQEKMMELFRSTVVLLSPFLQFSGVPAIYQKFEVFKEKLQNDTSIDQIEKAFKVLKETVLQYGIKSEQSPKGVKKLLGFFNKHDKDLLDKIKDVFSEIILALDSLIPEPHRERWISVQDSFWRIQTIQDFPPWNTNFARFLKELIAQLNHDRKELDEFISELGQNLVEIEKNITSSLDYVHNSQEMTNKFNYHLDGQINDLRQSVRTTSNLEELRKVLVTKLSYIRQVLEKKRKQEEEYNRELEERIQKLQKELTTINDQIKQVKSREKHLAEEILKDPLTGIANRRAYEIRIAEEWERFKRYGHIFSVAVFDLDHFKNVNDSYGHKAGDLILKEVARLMRSSLRKSDLIARYGGEEFVIIFTGTNINGAIEASEKLRQLIEKTKFVFKKQDVPITVSAGVAQVESTDQSPADVFDRADRALYTSKSEGRNRVTSYQGT